MNPFEQHRNRVARAVLALGVAALGWAGCLQVRTSAELDAVDERARDLAGHVVTACTGDTRAAGVLGPACRAAADVRADPDPDGSDADRPSVCVDRVPPAAPPAVSPSSTSGG